LWIHKESLAVLLSQEVRRLIDGLASQGNRPNQWQRYGTISANAHAGIQIWFLKDADFNEVVCRKPVIAVARFLGATFRR